MSEKMPILYSFRRCPYAIRARMALFYSGIEYELREVNLRNKPAEMLAISPKGTVPVLQIASGEVIDESLDIIFYALEQNDPEGMLDFSEEVKKQINQLIDDNDTKFAKLLRKYKYFENYPEQSQAEYRKQIEDEFLVKYENMLKDTIADRPYFFAKKSIADIAILPFIRQFAFVDEDWFFTSNYKNLITWLKAEIDNDNFENIILAKKDPW